MTINHYYNIIFTMILINYWNNKAEQLADMAVNAVPVSMEYRPQVKIAVVWMAQALLLQAAFVPIIPYKISCSIGVLVTVTLADRVAMLVKKHLSECDSSLSINEKIVCVAMPILLTLADVYLATSWVEFVSTLYVIGSSATLFSSAILFTERQEEQQKVELQQGIENLQKEQQELQRRIRLFDNFISSHPKLKEKFLESSSKDHIAELPEVNTNHLNPNDLIDQNTLIRLDNIKLRHVLNERMIYVQSDGELWELFKTTFQADPKLLMSS